MQKIILENGPLAGQIKEVPPGDEVVLREPSLSPRGFKYRTASDSDTECRATVSGDPNHYRVFVFAGVVD